MSKPLTITLPPAVLEQLVDTVAERVLERLADRDDAGKWPEWMSVETAARYLDVSPERVRKLQARRELPHYQEAPGCRVSFRRADLDAAMRRWEVG